jgi:hypothetical protein
MRLKFLQNGAVPELEKKKSQGKRSRATIKDPKDSVTVKRKRAVGRSRKEKSSPSDVSSSMNAYVVKDFPGHGYFVGLVYGFSDPYFKVYIDTLPSPPLPSPIL